MRIFLVRHAEAAPGDPDELRPLTPEGRATAREVGERLAAQHIDAVVSSPLLRARETADAIAKAANLEAETDERLAPGAEMTDLSAAVSERGDRIVVVGHQPDCSEIVLALTGQEVSFAPGGVRELDL
ncbi:MAG TPA: phosphohistidine phosphatase SixA [Gaiellaceae bacterium]|jgi:phosphohistidine phosphatase SixA